MATSSDSQHDHEPREFLPSVFASLPGCPRCGAKDRSLRVGKTYRPFGQEDDYKVQYTTCADCGQRFKIEWE